MAKLKIAITEVLDKGQKKKQPAIAHVVQLGNALLIPTCDFVEVDDVYLESSNVKKWLENGVLILQEDKSKPEPKEKEQAQGKAKPRSRAKKES